MMCQTVFGSQWHFGSTICIKLNHDIAPKEFVCRRVRAKGILLCNHVVLLLHSFELLLRYRSSWAFKDRESREDFVWAVLDHHWVSLLGLLLCPTKHRKQCLHDFASPKKLQSSEKCVADKEKIPNKRAVPLFRSKHLRSQRTMALSDLMKIWQVGLASCSSAHLTWIQKS